MKRLVQRQFVTCQALCGRWQHGLLVMATASKLLLAMAKQRVWRRALRLWGAPGTTARANVAPGTLRRGCSVAEAISMCAAGHQWQQGVAMLRRWP